MYYIDTYNESEPFLEHGASHPLFWRAADDPSHSPAFSSRAAFRDIISLIVEQRILIATLEHMDQGLETVAEGTNPVIECV
jgi:hypothetical protein